MSTFKDRKPNPTRIHLRGDGNYEEGPAGAVIKPGMLVALGSDGKYVPHATDGGAAEKLFALEDALQGKTIADSYAVDDNVCMVAGEPGDIFYALLADGEHINTGDLLESDGTGRFEKHDSGIPLAVALEQVLTDSGTVGDARIRVRTL